MEGTQRVERKEKDFICVQDSGKLFSDSEVGKQPFYLGGPHRLSKMASFPKKRSRVR